MQHQFSSDLRDTKLHQFTLTKNGFLWKYAAECVTVRIKAFA